MRKTRHVRPALFRSASAGLLAAVVAALFATSTVRAAPGPLVIDGETIGDAALIGDAQKEGKLTVYSASPIAYEKQLLARFTADTGIPGEAIRLTSELLYQRVTSEAAGHRLGADFVDLSDPTLENQLADTGILRAYRAGRSQRSARPLVRDLALGHRHRGKLSAGETRRHAGALE